jgi:hypothetical protein
MLSKPGFDLVRVPRALAALSAAALMLAAEPAAADPRSAVERELEEARAPASQLAPAGSRTSLGTRFHRFDQEVGRVPVLGAEAVVGEAPGAEGDLLVDATRSRIDSPPRPRVARSAATRGALRGVELDRLARSPEAQLAILPDGRGGRLVWRVLLAGIDPPRDLEVLVDARSSAVVRERDLTLSARGSARIFAPNPVVEHVARGGEPEDLTNSPGGVEDGNSQTLTDLRLPVTLRRLNAGQDCLIGKYAYPRLPSGDVCADALDFDSVKRRNDRFEAVMAYAFVDGAQGYIKALGFTGAGDRRQRIEVNATSQDQSFYQPFSQRITLGTGGVDDGEDADVILHEYGHAVQDDQVPFFGLDDESSAMGEGFGDYLAASISDFIPNGTANSDACMFEWDARGYNPPTDCERRTDLNLTVSQVQGPPCRSEPHCAGEAWSGALWDLRAQLGNDGMSRPIADVLAIQSHFYLTASASFDDGAEALIAADEALYGGAHEDALRDLLSDRGFLDS